MRLQKLVKILSAFLLAIIIGVNCSKKEKGFKEQIYYAITPEGLQQLKIQHDTLSLSKCTDTAQCNGEPEYQFKIVDTRKVGEAYVLYTETLRYLNASWKAPNKYRVLGLVYGADGQSAALVKEIIDYPSLDASKIKGYFNPFYKFAISYYTPQYIKTLTTYRSITTIDSNASWNLKKRLVKEAILNKEMIRRTHTGDLFMNDITRELINRALIAQKINPLINQQELDSAARKLTSHVNLK